MVVCAAAFFRNKGKEVITAKEFTMGVSLDFRWMPVKEANALITLLIDNKILEKNGDYLKPLIDITEIDVPVAYRPSAEFLETVTAAIGKKPEPVKEIVESAPLLPDLLSEAEKSGLKKGPFIAECNGLVKSLNIDMEIAALIVLRDHGADISPYIERAYSMLKV